jgi:hypothetical protein
MARTSCASTRSPRIKRAHAGVVDEQQCDLRTIFGLFRRRNKAHPLYAKHDLMCLVGHGFIAALPWERRLHEFARVLLAIAVNTARSRSPDRYLSQQRCG